MKAGGEMDELLTCTPPPPPSVSVSVPGHIDAAAEQYLQVYNALDKLVALTRGTVKEPTALSNLDNLHKILKGMP